MFGECCSSQDSATAVGGRAEPPGDRLQHIGLQRREAAEREVRHVRDVLLGRFREHRRVRPVGDVVEVLHARHWDDALRLGQLVEADRAQAQVPDQALLLQFGECLELPSQLARNRRAVVDPGEGPQVDHVEHVEPEPAEVVVHLCAQRIRRVAGQPAAPLVADHPTLVTMCTWSPYGKSASRMISLVVCGP